MTDLYSSADELAGWPSARIVTEAGRLVRIDRRSTRYKASRLRVAWDSWRRPAAKMQCELYFHQQPGNPDYLVLGYVSSHPQASLSSLYCAVLALDEIARFKASHAIVAEVTNARLSDRLLARWGWEKHCLSWRGRHFIKRFYGKYPAINPFWRARLRGIGEVPPAGAWELSRYFLANRTDGK